MTRIFDKYTPRIGGTAVGFPVLFFPSRRAFGVRTGFDGGEACTK
ncbi:hypothetical protein [Streptomyces sp. NPDC054863]